MQLPLAHPLQQLFRPRASRPSSRAVCLPCQSPPQHQTRQEDETHDTSRSSLVKLHVGQSLNVAPGGRGSVGVADAGVVGLDVLEGVVVGGALGSGQDGEKEGGGEEGEEVGELHGGWLGVVGMS